jgi:hypothetical protein
MLEARGSNTLFTVVNRVNCAKEYCLPLNDFIGEKHQLGAKLPPQVKGRYTVDIGRESFILLARGSGTSFKIGNSVTC